MPREKRVKFCPGEDLTIAGKDYVLALPPDPLAALLKVAEDASKRLSFYENRDMLEVECTYRNLLHYFALIKSIIDKHELHFETEYPDMVGDKAINAHKIAEYILHLASTLPYIMEQNTTNEILNASISMYSAVITGNSTFTLSDRDFSRVQEIVNELRELIRDSSLFTDDHKRRLLLKLESLQTELHKEMSSIDKVWAFIGDAGAVLGRFGTNSKPFVDRLRELFGIFGDSQAVADGLPPGSSFQALLPGEQDKA